MASCRHRARYPKEDRVPTKKPPRNFDQPIKAALLAASAGLFQLLGLSNARFVRELNPEVVTPRRTADIAWLVAIGAQMIIIHLEIQIVAEADMAWRIAEYHTRLHFREHYPVRSFVLYLKPVADDRLPVSPYATTLPDGTQSFSCAFDVIKLWEFVPESVLQTPYAELWPLAVLMQGTGKDLAMQIGHQIAAAPLPYKKRVELESDLVLFAGLRLPALHLARLMQEDTMLKDIFKHSSLRELLLQEVEQEVSQERLAAEFTKGEKQGLKQGIRKGRAEGRKEGEAKGITKGELTLARKLLREFVVRQFGTLSAPARKRIGATTDIARLEAALLHLTTFADEAALLTFLEAAPDPPPPARAE
jgi:hypothetical protein